MFKTRSILVLFVWVLNNFLIFSSCGISLETPPDTNPPPESPFESKSVDIFTWKKLPVTLYSDTNQIPDFFVINRGIFYAARKNSPNIFSWRKNDVSSVAVLGGAPSGAVNNFSVSINATTTVSVNPSILALDTFDTQIVAVTTNGAAFFSGQTAKAIRVAKISGNLNSVVNTANIDNLYFYIIGQQANIRKIVWLPKGGSLTQFQGFFSTGQVMGFSSGINKISNNNNFAAIAPYPNNNKLALAIPKKGLFTIDSDNIGKLNSQNPKIEQKDLKTPVNTEHANQWGEAGGDPKIISDMKLVENKYLLIGFGKDSGGLVFADMGLEEIKFVPVEFENVANKEVIKIIVVGKTAQIITDTGVMSFKEGAGEKVFVASELDQEPKLQRDFDAGDNDEGGDTGKEPLKIEDFRGGHVGDSPGTDTKFKSAAFFEGDWYYLTNKGVFQAEKEVKTRTFRK